MSQPGAMGDLSGFSAEYMCKVLGQQCPLSAGVFAAFITAGVIAALWSMSRDSQDGESAIFGQETVVSEPEKPYYKQKLENFEKMSLCGLKKVIPLDKDQEGYVVAGFDPSNGSEYQLRQTGWPMRQLPTFLLLWPFRCWCWREFTQAERVEANFRVRLSKFVERGRPSNWVIPLSTREALCMEEGKVSVLIARSNLCNKCLKHFFRYFPQVVLVVSAHFTQSSSLVGFATILGLLPAMYMCVWAVHRRWVRERERRNRHWQKQKQKEREKTGLSSGGSGDSRLSKHTIDYIMECVPWSLVELPGPLSQLLSRLPRVLPLFDIAPSLTLVVVSIVNLATASPDTGVNTINSLLVLLSTYSLFVLLWMNFLEYCRHRCRATSASGTSSASGSTNSTNTTGAGTVHKAVFMANMISALLAGLALAISQEPTTFAMAGVELVRLSQFIAKQEHQISARADSPSVQESVGIEGKRLLLKELVESDNGWIRPGGPFLSFVCGSRENHPLQQLAYNSTMRDVLDEAHKHLGKQKQTQTKGGRTGWQLVANNYPFQVMVTFQEWNTRRDVDITTRQLTTRQLLERYMGEIEGSAYRVNRMDPSLNWRLEIATVRGYTLTDMDPNWVNAGPDQGRLEGWDRKQLVVTEGTSGNRLTQENIKRLNDAINNILMAGIGQWPRGKKPHVYVVANQHPPVSDKPAHNSLDPTVFGRSCANDVPRGWNGAVAHMLGRAVPAPGTEPEPFHAASPLQPVTCGAEKLEGWGHQTKWKFAVFAERSTGRSTAFMMTPDAKTTRVLLEDRILRQTATDPLSDAIQFVRRFLLTDAVPKSVDPKEVAHAKKRVVVHAGQEALTGENIHRLDTCLNMMIVDIIPVPAGCKTQKPQLFLVDDAMYLDVSNDDRSGVHGLGSQFGSGDIDTNHCFSPSSASSRNPQQLAPADAKGSAGLCGNRETTGAVGASAALHLKLQVDPLTDGSTSAGSTSESVRAASDTEVTTASPSTDSDSNEHFGDPEEAFHAEPWSSPTPEELLLLPPHSGVDPCSLASLLNCCSQSPAGVEELDPEMEVQIPRTPDSFD